MRLNALSCLKRLAFIAGVVSLAQSADAGTPVIYTDGDTPLFQVEVPDFWTVRTGGLRDLSAPDAEDFRDVSRIFGMTPDSHEGIWVGFISPNGVETLEAARAYLRDISQFLVKDAKVDTSKRRTIAGRSAQTFSGTGRRNGKSLAFTAITIQLPRGRVAVSVVVFESGSDVEIINDINDMMATFVVAR